MPHRSQTSSIAATDLTLPEPIWMHPELRPVGGGQADEDTHGLADIWLLCKASWLEVTENEPFFFPLPLSSPPLRGTMAGPCERSFQTWY